MAELRPKDVGGARPEAARSWALSVDALYDPKVRGILAQVLLVAVLIWLGYSIVSNTAANLAKQNITSGFGFLERSAGFDISQTLIPYSSKSTYVAAFFVGLANTVLVAVIGIAVATALGFALGIARLSPNWLVSRLALTYVEIVRNIPLLLQLLIWYVAVLRALPKPADAAAFVGGAYLDVRGLHVPRLDFAMSPWLPLLLGAAVFVGAVAVLRRIAAQRLALTGAPFPLASAIAGVGAVVLLALIAALGVPSVTQPTLGRYNYEGGVSIEPEFLALLFGLSTYTAAFIAEIVRAGLQGVPKGQSEAAAALGLSRGQSLRLVVIPQAMRIIIPPLTNQFLNLTKNSSLAVAIGYPDLVSVFSGTVLNQTGQAVEVIVITMLVYLTLSLSTAAFMNWFNARVALVER